MPFRITFPRPLRLNFQVGLSEFHHRDGLDISMPLFSMVTFTPEQRRVPATERKYLVTFRGTKSARSDAVRNHLPRIHNGKQVLLLESVAQHTPEMRWSPK